MLGVSSYWIWVFRFNTYIFRHHHIVTRASFYLLQHFEDGTPNWHVEFEPIVHVGKWYEWFSDDLTMRQPSFLTSAAIVHQFTIHIYIYVTRRPKCRHSQSKWYKLYMFYNKITSITISIYISFLFRYDKGHLKWFFKLFFCMQEKVSTLIYKVTVWSQHFVIKLTAWIIKHKNSMSVTLLIVSKMAVYNM